MVFVVFWISYSAIFAKNDLIIRFLYGKNNAKIGKNLVKIPPTYHALRYSYGAPSLEFSKRAG